MTKCFNPRKTLDFPPGVCHTKRVKNQKTKNQMKKLYTENELSPEALNELAALNVNVGASYRVVEFDTLIDDEWLNEFVEDYNF